MTLRTSSRHHHHIYRWVQFDWQDYHDKCRHYFQEVSPSARPVYINVLSEEDIEQKIREVNSAVIKKQFEKEISEEIKETVEEETEPVSNNFSTMKIEEEINIIEEMINENKMMEIVSDIINLEERQNDDDDDNDEESYVSLNEIPVILEEKKNIKNIDGFDISLKNLPEIPSLMEIPISSEILIINDPVDEDSKPVHDDLTDLHKVAVKKSPISSIDFGLIQEV